MTAAGELHEDHGATFDRRAGRRVVSHYGRPERTHLAVRNGVGVIEMDYGVVAVGGDDRYEYVDNVITNAVPRTDGEGCYALVCDPQGTVETDMYVYDAGDRLLLLLPPGRAGPLAEDWASKVFVQDVTVREVTDGFAVFGVHGPTAPEKIATVLGGPAAPDPDDHLSFVRGRMHDAGVTVAVADAPAGEEGYEVICEAADAADVFDTLLARGMGAVPFGRRTWETLTLEAGTPLFASELEGRLPNVCGIRNAVDFEKGCFVGQEVVSKVENRGRPSARLVGLRPEAVPEAGATVRANGDPVGEVTRAADAPSLGGPAALAAVPFDAAEADGDLAVEADGGTVPAPRADLPFVEGSARSARLPTYATE
ncbi:MAG: aminomethyltransferase family protein [Haloferacaceae archaeon]